MEALANSVCNPNSQQRSLHHVDCKTGLLSTSCSQSIRCRAKGGQFVLDAAQNNARENAGASGDDCSMRKRSQVWSGSAIIFGLVPSPSFPLRSDRAEVLRLISKGKRWIPVRRTGSSAKITSLRAQDSSQHDTADRNDAASDEKQSSNLEGEARAGALVQFAGARSDCSSSSVQLAGSSVEARSQGLVLGLGPSDAWDGGSVWAPVVKRYLSDNDERWLMWYTGRAAEGRVSEEASTKGGNESIGLAISSNGMHWERGNGSVDSNEHGSQGVGKVFDCSTNWWAFDTEIIRPSDVLVMSSLKVRAAAGVYWMYYTGGCPEEVEIPKSVDLPENLPDFTYRDGKIAMLRTRPGLVMSHDGRNWARVEGDHHSGSLFDVGAENEWDSLFIAAPHVVFFNADDLRMYYHSYDPKSGRFSAGFARSRDGMRWVKFGKILGGGAPGSFDELGVKAPQVVAHPDGKGYLMIYEGVAADGSSSFGLAQSPDGLYRWERCGDKPVFSPSSAALNAWDSKEIHCPCLVHMDGQEWRLYYQGVDGDGVPGIGMATCADGTLQEFHRCQGLHF